MGLPNIVQAWQIYGARALSPLLCTPSFADSWMETKFAHLMYVAWGSASRMSSFTMTAATALWM